MISEFTFGRIVVDGTTYSNDIKIVAGRVVPDWWRASGHRVEVNDVDDILTEKPDALVIGKGQPGYMRVSDQLRSRLQKSGIELVEQATPQAIDTYNRLVAAGRPVCAGFHIGC